MIRSKTFCKFFQIQSSFPLQSFLKKKRISAAIWARSLLPFLFTLPIFCQIKKNWHKVSFINCQNYYFRWMKIDIAFLRNAFDIVIINFYTHCVPTERKITQSSHYQIITLSNHQIIASSNHRIIALSHQNPHFHHTSFHFLVSSFNIVV